MPLFKYTARNSQGKIVQGSMDTANQESLVRSLRTQGLLVTSVSTGPEKAKPGNWKSWGQKVKLDDLIVFSRQLATMVSAGLPLIESLDVLGQQMENPILKNVIVTVQRDVEGGSTLTAAIDKHPKVFSELFVNMVKAGEASGMLDGILTQLASYLEKSGALQRKVKGAMIYPAVVSSLATLITLFIMIFIIPRFQTIYTSLHAELPMPTQVLLGISNLMVKYFYVWIILLVGGGWGFNWYIKTDKGRLWFDNFKLNLPVFGDLFRKVAVAKFTRTLSTLVRSGVNIIQALEIVAKTSGNVIIERAVIKTKMSIQEGESISVPLTQTGVFPPMVTRMISVGERTGALEEMLQKVATFYEEQVDAAVAALTSLIEPILIVFMGVVIGGIVICMYLPIFSMVSAVSK